MEIACVEVINEQFQKFVDCPLPATLLVRMHSAIVHVSFLLQKSSFLLHQPWKKEEEDNLHACQTCEMILLQRALLIFRCSKDSLEKEDVNAIMNALQQYWSIPAVDMDVLTISLQIPLMMFRYGLWDDPDTATLLLSELGKNPDKATEREIEERRTYLIQ